MVTNVVELDPRAIARERARETTSAIGMMVALGAFGMMFASLVFVYLGLRAQTKTWPPPGLEVPLALPAINTLVMLASSATLQFGLRRLRGGSRGAALFWTALTLTLGSVFIGLQLLLWRGLWQDGITFSTGTLGTVIYALTSLHALHVLGGLAALGYILGAAIRGAHPKHNAHMLRLCGMFWHFVDAVWVVMFVAMFLL